MEISDLVKYFENLDEDIDNIINESFIRESRYYKRLLAQFTPRDTGQLSQNWKIDYDNSNNLRSANIKNDLVYAFPIEFGSEIDKRPWPSPGPRTEEFNSRIFSIQAIDGVAENAINDSDIDMTLKHMMNDITRIL